MCAGFLTCRRKEFHRPEDYGLAFWLLARTRSG